MKKTNNENKTFDLSKITKVIGLKQVVKHAEKKEIRIIYLASDVDSFVETKILAIAEKHSIPIFKTHSMYKLGLSCGIDVGAACVGILS
jgi:large subunit ribosomal protein L7A